MARRTLQSYLDLMSHGLGKTPDSRHLLIDTFNDAGRALFGLASGAPHFHQWTWAVRDNVAFTLPGGLVSEVALPRDFGTLVSIIHERNFVGRIVPTTMANLANLRRNVTSSPLITYIAFGVGSKQGNSQQGPDKIAAFWPPRSDPFVNLRLTYRREWVDFEPTDLNAIPDTPAQFDRLLSLLARAYAIHFEDQAEADEDRQVVAELDRMVNYDALRQTNVGRAEHSVNRAGQINSLESNWYGLKIIR